MQEAGATDRHRHPVKSTWFVSRRRFSMDRVWLVALLGFMLSNAFGDSLDVQGNALLDNINQKSFWESRFTTHIPILKMLRRHVRRLNNGSEQSLAVTLVYQATQQVKARWFRRDNNTLRLINSEVPQKILIEGDPNYEQSYMRSGEVTAATLTIHRVQDGVTYDLDTILTSNDSTVQYQMSTVIRPRPDPLRPEYIDSPEWLLVAPAQIAYNVSGSLDIHCAAFVARENTTHTNELIMSRATIAEDGGFRVEPLLRIHKDTQDVVEGMHDNVMFIGKRVTTSIGHVIYYIRLSWRNATQAFTGVYQCSMERKEDRLFLLSTVQMIGGGPLLPRTPYVEFISCEDNYDKHQQSLLMNEGVATCFRCRAVASPKARVAVYRESQELRQGPGVGVTRYDNVMDSGFAEVTYTFHSPNASLHGGVHYCNATSGHGDKTKTNSIRFRVTVARRKRGKY